MSGSLCRKLGNHLEHIHFSFEPREQQTPLQPLLHEPCALTMSPSFEMLRIMAGNDETCFAHWHIRFCRAVNQINITPVIFGGGSIHQHPSQLLS